MGGRSAYAPGTFCWAELSTTDQAAAKAFYGGLLGWEAADQPLDGGAVYSMMRLDGRDVAAIAAQPPQQREAGVPAMWNSYVSVESADAAVARAQELGGTGHSAAFDVMEAGRMAVLQDPQGAFFEVWEPRAHFGAALVNEPGALVWNELSTTDPDAAAAFYSGLFGWTIEQAAEMQERYLMITNGSANNGGIRELAAPGLPAHWLVYFGAAEVDPALATVERLGGSRLAGPIDIGIATIAVVADPQGAVFALYAGELEP